MGQSNEKFKYEQSIKKRLHRGPFRVPTQRDVEFLNELSLLSQPEIITILNNFVATHPNGKMTRKEFCDLYIQFRQNLPVMVEGLTENVFKALGVTSDADMLTLDEFLMTFALTTRGDIRKRLEYAFDIYVFGDRDYLDLKESRAIVYGMIEILSDANPDKSKDLASVAADICDDVKTPSKSDKIFSL